MKKVNWIVSIVFAVAITVCLFIGTEGKEAKAESYYTTENDLSLYVIAKDTPIYSYSQDSNKNLTINVSGHTFNTQRLASGTIASNYDFTYIKGEKPNTTTWSIRTYNASNVMQTSLLFTNQTETTVYKTVIVFDTEQDLQTFMTADNGKIGQQFQLLTDWLEMSQTTPPESGAVYPDISVTAYATYGSFPYDLEMLDTTYQNGQMTITINGNTMPIGLLIFFGREEDGDVAEWTPITMAELGSLRRDFMTVSYSGNIGQMSATAFISTSIENSANVIDLNDSTLYAGYWDTTGSYGSQPIYGLMMTVPSGIQGQVITLSFRNSDFMAGYNEGQRALSYDRTVTYNTGYAAGLATSETGSFHDLFTAVFDVPVQALWGMFDFTVSGVDVRAFVGSIILIGVVATIMRRFL